MIMLTFVLQNESIQVHRTDKAQNMFISFLIVAERDRFATPHNVLIINLACSDLLMVLTMFPVMFVSVAKKQWIFGETGK